MSESGLLLPGLDASNPLAYFAALGTLQVVSDSGKATDNGKPWRLSWRDEGRCLAELHGTADPEVLIQCLYGDVASWNDELCLQLAYDSDGNRLSPAVDKAIFDLKPVPETFRSFADEVAITCGPKRLRSARMVAAYGSELATDNNGNLKPTALHFTAGQQSFLGMVRALQQGLAQDDFREALLGPWRNESKLPSLSWNASAARVYAYRADNPSGEKRGSVPAADWLAFVGLRFFPVISKRSGLLTACVQGGWKDSVLRWPVWTVPSTVNAVRSLLTRRSLHEADLRQRSSAGVAMLFESKILRSDQGGYGSFSPGRVL